MTKKTGCDLCTKDIKFTDLIKQPKTSGYVYPREIKRKKEILTTKHQTRTTKQVPVYKGQQRLVWKAGMSTTDPLQMMMDQS